MKRILTVANLATAVLFGSHAIADTKIGAIFDLTGGLNIYGIQQNNALKLAVEKINLEGGLLGNKVEVVSYDAQSELNKYTQFTHTAILRDRVDVLFAGLTSSSREAIRPIVRKAKIPYFYSSLYEGGACDKYTFVTGSSASQQLSVLIDWAIKKYGSKIYVMAPDYNFGTISAHWINEYARKNGGEVVGEDFLPLTVTDYSPTIQKIQAAKPDFVVALPVGANQTGFLEQFSAAGLKDNIGIVSTNYGSGNQQVVVSPKAGTGLIASQGYFQEVSSPENAAFVSAWQEKYGSDTPIVSGAVDVWNAVHLWANAVKKAKSSESEPVITALESGISFSAPNGTVTLQGGSHHLTQNIYIAEGNDKHGFNIINTFENVDAVYEGSTCDLISNPNLVAHFIPESL
ncbi:urea ABC transporter substrate-binding protein [Vibrio nigripulchritudo]|uniref:urea ABC transporter substrate-binding protein n=1 Tax=Vibrio nigripulchritudo TaxID=28173 RepID=UPI00249269A5|nr:ABC transporter substrate-binding protein [Vibrio nigripulchritudo]BDU41153.1 branched-chain amino acid ABC transporter substrate-binding protein [Vibrio nigripulchritudo]BDU46918.1 branched-chain amino acid ABC transporter substrate-binding protein [Vibrio nigripulchritudo]